MNVETFREYVKGDRISREFADILRDYDLYNDFVRCYDSKWIFNKNNRFTANLVDCNWNEWFPVIADSVLLHRLRDLDSSDHDSDSYDQENSFNTIREYMMEYYPEKFI